MRNILNNRRRTRKEAINQYNKDREPYINEVHYPWVTQEEINNYLEWNSYIDT